MKIFGILYLLLSIAFLFFPSQIIYLINFVPLFLHFQKQIPLPQSFFWTTLSAALVFLLSALSFLAIKHPFDKTYPLLVMLSKAFSVLGFVYALWHHQTFFAYTLGCFLDSSVFFILLYSLFIQKRAKKHA